VTKVFSALIEFIQFVQKIHVCTALICSVRSN